jgi:hypothetical protein
VTSLLDPYAETDTIEGFRLQSTFAVYSPILPYILGFVWQLGKGQASDLTGIGHGIGAILLQIKLSTISVQFSTIWRCLVSAILGRIIRELGRSCLTVDLPSIALQPKDFAAMLNCGWRLSNQKRRGNQ